MPLKRIRHPFFFGTIAQQQFRVGAASSVGLAQFVTNPEQRSLTYSLVSGPTGFSVSGSSLNWSGNGVDQQATVQVQATDGVFTSRGAVPVSVLPAAVSDGRFEFAVIPEIVFVRGFADSEHLGPWMLDPENRWTPGDIENASGWVPNRAISVSGSLPAGVSFSQTTGILSYDGSSPTSGTESATVALTDGTVTSETFRVRVLKPTMVWGDGALSDPAVTANWPDLIAANAVRDPADGELSGFGATQSALVKTIPQGASDTNPNVILILGGTYQGISYGTGNTNGSLFLKSSPGFLYIIGDPRSRPVIQGNSVSSNWAPTSARLWYVKHLRLNDFKLSEGSYTNAEQDIADKNCYYCDLVGRDFTRSISGIGSDNRETEGGWAWDTNKVRSFIWKLDTLRYGGLDSTHQMYMEGRWLSELHLNLVRLRGGRRASACKSTRWFKAMHNSYLTVFENDADPTVGQRCQELIDWVGDGVAILYNNYFRGAFVASTAPEPYSGGTQYGVVRKRQRYDHWGCDSPAYPNVSFDPPTTTFAHGGYAPPPGFGPGPDTYVNPAFWAAVNALPISDPANPYQFPWYMSYCTFEWVEEGYGRKAWFSDHGTAPRNAAVQFSTNTIPGTIPAGWIERSTNFFCNNTLIGWTSEDTADEDKWLNLTEFSDYSYQTAPVGNWTTATAYSVGDWVISSAFNYVYECTTGGTSGATQPSGTGSGISDGGCIWKCMIACEGAYWSEEAGRWVNGPGPWAVDPVPGSVRYWYPDRAVHYNDGLVTPWGGEFSTLPSWFKIAGEI